MKTKRLIYQVSIGKPSKLYKICTESVNRYCEKYDIDHVVQTRPILNIKPDPFQYRAEVTRMCVQTCPFTHLRKRKRLRLF